MRSRYLAILLVVLAIAFAGCIRQEERDTNTLTEYTYTSIKV